MLQIRLLGQFAVLQNGEPIEIPSRPAQSLFAYLVLHAGKPVRRERMAGIYWPDSSESNARNNLRQAIWRIRQALRETASDQGYIRSDSMNVWFEGEGGYSLDVQALESKAGDALELLEVVAVYEGEFLPGFYDDWVLTERQRLERLYGQKLRMCLDQLLSEGRWDEALELAEKAIALIRSVEPSYRAIMTAHAQLGDLASVSDAYQRCLQTLQDEGLDPSEETRTLYEQLLQGELPPAARPTPAGPPPGLETEPREEVFVARDQELSQLDSWLQSAVAGEGKIAFIAGVAGSGKSALLREFARRARGAHADLLVCFSHCNALTGHSDPFHPFRQIVAQLAGDYREKHANGSLNREHARALWDQMGMSIHAILEGAPGLIDTLVSADRLLMQAELSGVLDQEALRHLRRLSRRTLRGIDPEQRQANLYEAFGRLLTSTCARSPMLILVDDLQWIDLHSVSLLFHLARQITSQRVLMVGAYRSDEVMVSLSGEEHPLHHVLAEVKRMVGNVEIPLSGENMAQGRAFIDAFLDTEPNLLGSEFRQALLDHTGGHPLFTIELLREMEYRGVIRKDEQGRWALGLDLDWGAMPARIEGVIEERLGRLDEHLYELLTAASVQGEEFEAEVCAGVLEVKSRQVVDQLSDELDKRHRLVLAMGTARIDGRRISRYRFRHMLFQKYLMASLDQAQREYMHEEVARQLEKLYGEQAVTIAGRLAEHFAQAGVPEKAADYFLEAGEQARYASVNEEAVELFGRGLEIVATMPNLHQRQAKELALQVSLGVALTAVKGYGDPDVEKAYGRARKLCQNVAGSPSLFPTLYGLRAFYVTRAKHRTALELGELLLRLATDANDPALLIEAHQAIGSSHFYMGNLGRSRQHLEHALSLYNHEVHDDLRFLYGQDPAVASQSYLAVTYWCLGHEQRTAEHNQRALELAERLDHPLTSALAHILAAVLHSADRDERAVSSHADQAIAISEKHGFPFWMTAGQVLKGWSLVVSGELEGGIANMQSALDAWINLGAELGRVHYLSLVAEALGEAGMIDMAIRLITEAEETLQRTGELIAESEVYRIKAGLLERQNGDPAQVERAYLHAIEAAKRRAAKAFELRSSVSLARHWIGQKREAKARKLLRRATRALPEGFGSLELQQAHELLQEL